MRAVLALALAASAIDDDAETGHVSPRGAISPISHGPSASTMVKVEPSGTPSAIDANDL